MNDDFNPNGAAEPGSSVFGFNYSIEDAKLVLIPVPWEATCSYGDGAGKSPTHIFDASMFVELYDNRFKDFYSKGIAWIPEESEIKKWSDQAKKLAAPIIERAGVLDGNLIKNQTEINVLCEKMNNWVEKTVDEQINKGKLIGLVGGDHSVSLGAIKALEKKYDNLGILQIDAHSDLRFEFESLKYSHASVFDNVLRETEIEKIVQIGVRGYCQEEHEKIISSNGRIETFYESDICDEISSGKNWGNICDKIINSLPENVYVSFDIDGLNPSNCPNTGTPMPGGLEYDQAVYLLTKLRMKRNIVGFDLVEVSCGKTGAESWDAIVAANLLYKLCACAIVK